MTDRPRRRLGWRSRLLFLQHEWEQVILAQDLDTEEAYLACQRAGRGSALTKAQRSQVWQVTQCVTDGLREAVPLPGPAPITGLDGEADTLRGYRSPMHGRGPELHGAATREGELAALAERIRFWLDSGIEAHAIGVAARSSTVANQARDALRAGRIPTLALNTQSAKSAVRVGTMHKMKGLEFQAVAVIGVEQGTVPASSAVTPAAEDPLAHDQDLQRERCIQFVACTRARDHLYVSYTGQPSPFLPS